MKTYSDIQYGSDKTQCLDLHLPACETFPVLLYFHGGGLTGGDKTRQTVFFNYMVAHGFAVVSANYRLYPTAKYPDFIEDAAAATAWVFANIGKYGKAGSIYVGGSSAGAYLSMMLCFDRRWLAKHGISPMQIAGFVHDSGQPTCHYSVLQEREIDKRRVIVDESAPLWHIGTDAAYPPMLILVSDNDMANRYEQTMLLVSTLKHFGHTAVLQIMHGKHCAHTNTADGNGNSIFGQAVCNFIRSKPPVE